MAYLIFIGLAAALYGWAVPKAFYGPLKFVLGAWFVCVILSVPISGIIKFLYHLGVTRMHADEVIAFVFIYGGVIVAGYVGATLALGLVLKMLSLLAGAASRERS